MWHKAFLMGYSMRLEFTLKNTNLFVDLPNLKYIFILSLDLQHTFIHAYLPTPRAGYDTRSIFKAEFNRFEFRVFLLLD